MRAFGAVGNQRVRLGAVNSELKAPAKKASILGCTLLFGCLDPWGPSRGPFS